MPQPTASDRALSEGANVQVILRLGPGSTARAVRALVKVLDAFDVEDDLDLFYGAGDGMPVSLGVRLELPPQAPV